jgi:acetyltransferase-like isoleucine patch superfamily enzyme
MGKNLLDPGYFTESDLKGMGFLRVGKNVRVGKNSTFIGLENISLGSNVRIDGNVTFACSSGEISIGSYVHIGGNSHISGSGGVEISDFCTISQGVRIYSASDDYSGQSLTNSTVPKEFRNEHRSRVLLRKHVILGSGTVILPGCNLGEGAAVGALSLVKSNLDDWSIYGGSPARFIKIRSRGLLGHNPEALLVGIK